MTVSITINCCVCGKPVKIEIEGWHIIPPDLRFRGYCPECIGKEPAKIEKIRVHGQEIEC